MRCGYFMMPMHVPGSDPAETLETDFAQIQRLDELGFEEAWIGEHFTAEWENIPAPEFFIAAALQRTKRIKLGTGVTCLPNHNPFHLAHRSVGAAPGRTGGRYRHVIVHPCGGGDLNWVCARQAAGHLDRPGGGD